MRVLSVHETGGSGVLVSVESSLSNSLPGIVLVGFAGKSLDESRERIRSAFSSSKLKLPRKRITVNISPSDVPKDGAHYDLAIALSVLTIGELVPAIPGDPVVLGELGLDGSIKPVRGVLGKMLFALQAGHKNFIIPKANLDQAALIPDIRVLAVSHLKDVVSHVTEYGNDDALLYGDAVASNEPTKQRPKAISGDLADVVGQNRAKRALEIAAAGNHNVLLSGPPGVGKSMLAKALPGIMPAPNKDEIITITHLHSLTSDTVTDLVRIRPFRSPHHSSSDVSIIGGGQRPKPGEVSLAHGGVLFLDELPEFRRGTIESLRQPLEDGKVTVSRAKDTVTYPANFMLVATKNPCPCGYYGSRRECTCSPIELHRYQKKLSGPILDRIDIHVTVDNIDHKDLLKKETSEEPSQHVKKRVTKAVEKQSARQGLHKRNASLGNKDIKEFAPLSSEAKDFIDEAAKKLQLSARVYMKMIKLARTIADLDNQDTIKKVHIAEALQYRPQRQE